MLVVVKNSCWTSYYNRKFIAEDMGGERDAHILIPIIYFHKVHYTENQVRTYLHTCFDNRLFTTADRVCILHSLQPQSQGLSDSSQLEGGRVLDQARGTDACGP